MAGMSAITAEHSVPPPAAKPETSSASERMPRSSIALSAGLHIGLFALILLGLPNLFRHKPPEEMPIAVDLVTIAPETRATQLNPFRPKPDAKPEAAIAPPAPKPEPKPEPPVAAPPPSAAAPPQTPTPPQPKPEAKPTPPPPPPKPVEALAPTPPPPEPQPIGARDAKDLVIEIRVSVGPDGVAQHAKIVDDGRPDPIFRAAAESARRAFFAPECTPLRVPAGKYELWKDLVVSFSPKDLL